MRGPALVQDTFQWCWGTEIRWFLAFHSRRKLQVNPGALPGDPHKASSRCSSTRSCPISSSLPLTRASPAPAPGTLCCPTSSVWQQSKQARTPQKLQQDHQYFSREVASVCELSCWWALLLFFSLKLSFRQLQALKQETSLEQAQFKKGKKSIPCLAEPLSVKQVTAPCLLSCHSRLLLDAHHKSTVVWTAALCWNLTVPPISDRAAFQCSPTGNSRFT